jgi:hypothetical protein
MKRILSLLLLAFCLSACASDRVTITVTITNAPSDADTITLNASTRTWKTTVATPSTQITIGADAGAAATNLFRQLSAYQLSGYPALNFSSSNVITIKGQPAQAMTASLSAAYGTIAYGTNDSSAQNIVRTEGAQTINGIKDFSSPIYARDALFLSNNLPRIIFYDADGGADAKFMTIVSDELGTSFIYEDDTYSNPQVAFFISRSGVTPESVVFISPLVATTIQGTWTNSAGTNITIGGTVIAGTNAVTGSMRYTRANHTSLANGNNAGADFGDKVFTKIKAGPTAAFAICGITGGLDGKEYILWNATGFNMTISHDSGVEPTAANRIYTATGADVVTTANGAARLIYDSEDSRWLLISSEP